MRTPESNFLGPLLTVTECGLLPRKFHWTVVPFETVLQEDADAVGLSILSGAHMTLVPKVIELLRAQDAGDVIVTVGGTIPAQDIPELKELGVAAVFTPGAPTQSIIDYIEGAVTP